MLNFIGANIGTGKSDNDIHSDSRVQIKVISESEDNKKRKIIV